jgi:nucleoside-diphosphate-sugar epimerase
MKRVLVTGAAGFIGRNAVRCLIAGGYTVHTAGRKPLESAGITHHAADLLRPGESARLVDAARPTHLLHLAWNVEHGKYWTSPANLQWMEASLCLLRDFVAFGGKRCVTAGTCAEYEWGHDTCVEGETPLKPATLYGVCKHSLQITQSAFCRSAGVSSAWGRIFHLYGPHEQEQRLVPSVTASLLSAEPALCTSGLQIRDFLHVEDVARALVAILASNLEGPVNIGSGNPVRLREVVDTLGQITGRTDLLRPGAIPANPNDPHRLIPDIARLRSIGFMPRFSLETGLRETVDWWRKTKRSGTETVLPRAPLSPAE